MILGIWTPDLSVKNTLALKKKGFNGIYVPIGYFYDNTQDGTVKSMKEHYLNYKEQGFEYFLIDASWGLGDYDKNYFYEKIIDAFKDCNDVEFYMGEPFVEAEKQKIDFADMYKILEQRKAYSKKWIVDAPDRQQDLYAFDALSSYSNQSKHWKPYHTFAWIYGSLTYTVLFGSLCYGSKKKDLEKLGISKIFLYQGDVDGLTIKWLNGYLQNKFIKTFGD